MRAQGVLSGPGGAMQADHICWVYDDPGSFGTVAREFLAQGLARGERLLCIGDAMEDTVRSGTAVLPDVEQLISGGTLEVLDVATAYERAGSVWATHQLAFYEAATSSALACGYSGLRVVADVTDLAADAARCPELLRWEHVADDFIGHGSGMTALCAYAGGSLDQTTITDLASVHPFVHAPAAPPFRIWSEDDVITLAGEVDMSGAERLSRLLATSPVRPVVVLDLTRVQFVDVAGCRSIAQWAIGVREQGARLVLWGASRMFRRMWILLGFAEVTGASFADPRTGEAARR